MAAVGQAVMIPKRDVTDRNVHCPSFWYLDNANNTWAMPLVNMAIHTQVRHSPSARLGSVNTPPTADAHPPLTRDASF